MNCPDMGVSKNRGTPKWMDFRMENPIKMDDLGGKPTIFGNIHIFPIKLKRFPAAMLPSKKKRRPYFPKLPKFRTPRSAGFIQPAASSLAHAPWGRSRSALRVLAIFCSNKNVGWFRKICQNSMDNPRNSCLRSKKKI